MATFAEEGGEVSYTASGLVSTTCLHVTAAWVVSEDSEEQLMKVGGGLGKPQTLKLQQGNESF